MSWATGDKELNLRQKLNNNPQYKNNLTLLLEDDEIFDYLISPNHNTIIKFIIQNTQLIHDLLRLITFLPQNSDSESLKYKYPLRSCIILNPCINTLASKPGTMEMRQAGCSLLLQALKIDGNKLFDSLFKFFNDKNILNSILPGYFERVFQVFSTFNACSKLVAYLQLNPNYIDSMIDFSESISVCKCIQGLILVDSKNDCGNIPKWIDFKKKVLQKCIDALKDKKKDEFILQNLIDLLAQLVEKQQIIYHKKELLQLLFRAQNAQSIFDLIMKRPSLSYQSTVLMNTMLTNFVPKEGQSFLSQSLTEDSKGFISQCASRLPQLFCKIVSPNLLSCEIMETLIICVRTNNQIISDSIMKSKENIFIKIFGFFALHPESDLLHKKIQKLVCSLAEHINQKFISFALIESKMIDTIIPQNKTKPAYLGVLYVIVQFISNRQSYTIIKKLVEENKQKLVGFVESDIVRSYHKTMISKYSEIQSTKFSHQNTYTVNKQYIGTKQQDKFQITPSFEISFQFNDQETVVALAPDTPDISVELSNTSFKLQPITLSQQQNVSSIKEDIKESAPKVVKPQQTFEDFMKSRREMVTTQMEQKSKTPNKKNERESSRSASKKKVNKWGNNNSENVPPSLSQNSISVKSVVQCKGSELECSKSDAVYLPKINIYQIPGHKLKQMSKTVPCKQRKLSPRRDNKLSKIMKAIGEHVKNSAIKV